MGDWVDDVLGVKFQQLTLPLQDDSEGPVRATLVRSLPDPQSIWQKIGRKNRVFENVDVLYVHGWSDYFFQTELAEFWTARGARFFALDLRRYGRSLQDDEPPGYVEHLETYDEEIQAAIKEIRGGSKTDRFLALLGHSTGGLVLSLWADRHPGEFDALILNSPWLEFQLSVLGRKAFTPIVELSARLGAEDAMPQIDLGFYSRAQREVQTAEHPLVINEKWRPERSMPVRPGWLKAILAGHAQVALGLEIKEPIMLMLSKRSVLHTKWSENMKSADTVLNVSEVAKAALHLGESVTIEKIDGALHDVFLSSPEPRADAYSRMEKWLKGILAR